MVFRRPPHFVEPESVYDDIVALGPVYEIQITGGEATLHPNFMEIAECARIARGDGRLALYTNGARLIQNRRALKFFDQVYMSIYDKRSRAGAPTPKETIDLAHASCRGVVPLQTLRMQHYSRSGGDLPCSRFLETASVLEGRIFPCCVANGVDGAESVPLEPGWEERLIDVPAPCGRCTFAGAS